MVLERKGNVLKYVFEEQSRQFKGAPSGQVWGNLRGKKGKSSFSPAYLNLYFLQCSGSGEAKLLEISQDQRGQPMSKEFCLTWEGQHSKKAIMFESKQLHMCQ